MSFPSPSLAVPALSVGQASFGGLTFGGIVQGATYNVKEIQGLDPPDVLSGDQQREQDQGEFAGLDVLPGRDITMVQNITGSSLSALANARMELAGVLGVKGNVEEPLYVQTEAGVFACMARPRRHHFPWDSNIFIAQAVTATTLWHATDPRWYLVPTKTASVGLAGAPKAGMHFSTHFSIGFGGGTLGGILPVANNGKFEMRPVLVVTGPCLNPTVSNLSLPGAPGIQVLISLNAGDTLTIDMDFQTIQYVAAGTTAASSRRNALAPGATWWNLPPKSATFSGTSTIEFSTEDITAVAGTLTVQSADAYIGL